MQPRRVDGYVAFVDPAVVLCEVVADPADPRNRIGARRGAASVGIRPVWKRVPCRVASEAGRRKRNRSNPSEPVKSQALPVAPRILICDFNGGDPLGILVSEFRRHPQTQRKAEGVRQRRAAVLGGEQRLRM